MTRLDDQAARDHALDPHSSVLVQAPAGAGKTTLLVERFLRLLALVDNPEEVIAITFTRKAAAEMRERILDAINADTDTAVAVRERSKQQGWRLTEMPSRLRIQTIDGFALSLVRQSPLSGGGGHHARVTDDPLPLIEAALYRLFTQLYTDDATAHWLADFVALFDNRVDAARRELIDLLSRRDQWLPLALDVLQTQRSDPEQLMAAFERIAESSCDRAMKRLRESLPSGAAPLLNSLLDASSRDDRSQPALAADLLTTRSGTLRKRLPKGQVPSGLDDTMKALLALLAQSAPLDLAYLRHTPQQIHPTHDEVNALTAICVTLALAATELEHEFERRSQVDFAGIVQRALRVLGTADAPTDFALSLDYRIRHVLIDEFQDTSIPQYQLIEQLLEGWTGDDGRTFFAVGDPMQSIYKFRDAEVSLFFNVRRNGISGIRPQSVHLSSNFRTAANTVAWYNDAFRTILGNIDQPESGTVAFVPSFPVRSTDPNARVHVQWTSEPAEMAYAVADHVAGLSRLRPTPLSIAVLVRAKAHMRNIIPALRDAGIPVQLSGIESVLDQPVNRDALMLYSAVIDPYDGPAWLALLRSPLVGLCGPDLEVAAAQTSLWDVFDAPLSPDGVRRIDHLAANLAERDRWLAEAGPREWLEVLWCNLGGPSLYPETANEHLLQFLNALDRVNLDDHDRATLERRLNSLDIESGAHSLARALSEQAAQAQTPTVQAMTIHRAKGLEFDHVIVPHIEATTRTGGSPVMRYRNLPGAIAVAPRAHSNTYRWLAYEDAEREDNERRRLLYVACTRARTSVAFFGVAGTRTQKGSFARDLEPLALHEVKPHANVSQRSPTHEIADPERRLMLAAAVDRDESTS